MKLSTVFFISLLSLQASAQSDSLDNYVKRLQQSKVVGDNETSFMSLGSDFLYAQEYFEAGNYGAATHSYEGILRQHKENS